MTLEKLLRDWQNFAWEWRYKGKLFKLVLKEKYRRCEFTKVGKKEVPALVFYNRYDDGSWANNPTILKCDKDGNCYNFNFSVSNITEYRWRKCGKFVKLPVTSK